MPLVSDWLSKSDPRFPQGKVGYFFDVQLGKMLDGKRISGNHLAPYVRNQDVQWWKVNTESLHLMDFDAEDRVKYRLRVGDVLVCEGGQPGRSAIWTEAEFDCYYQKAIHRLRPRDARILPKYFVYFMETAALAGGFADTASTISHLTAEELRAYPILAPPGRTQRAIVGFLDHHTARIDALIAKKRRLLELLEEKRRVITNGAITGHEKGSRRKHPERIEGISSIPGHWSTSRLGFEAVVKARLGWKGLKASEYTDEGPILLSTPNIKGENIDWVNVNHISEYRYLESLEIALQEGDVLLAKDGFTLGTCNMVRHLPGPATVNSSIAVIRPTGGRLTSEYLLLFLKSHYMQSLFVKMRDGMDILHLFQEDIRKFDILLPPVEEQDRIASFIKSQNETFRSRAQTIEKQIGLLQEKRSALITAAVTGQLDVSTWTPPAQGAPA